MMQCGCRSSLQLIEIEECPSELVFAKFRCDHCGFLMGIEGAAKEVDSLVPQLTWTDEAWYQLTRLPPYLAPLVLEEVEAFASVRQQRVVTSSGMASARNKGMVEWSPEAEHRLNNVPSGIRAMAKIELERTALDREMPMVTVALMEEVKARYFGMAAGRT